MNTLNKTLVFVATTVIMAGTMFPVLSSSRVYAATPDPTTRARDAACAGVGLPTGDNGCDVPAGSRDASSIVGTIVNILSIVVGILAVIFIIIGGIKYITSSGEANNITSAKNTIMFAIVGLVVVALAQLIVRFVLGRITKSDSSACSSSQVWSSSEEKCVPIND